MEIFPQAFFRDVSKMAATVVEKAFCVLELAKTNSVLLYSVISEDDMANLHLQGSLIYDWSKKFQETGCLCEVKSFGRLPVSEEAVELDYRIDICRVTKGSLIEHL